MKRTITVLQAGRAVAAMAVLLHHSTVATQDFVQPLPRWLSVLLENGFRGVDFFFVLSGFIILHAHGGDVRTGAAAWTYAKKRLRRIYIPYLPISIGLIALYTLLPGFSASTRDWSLITSLTLFPTTAPPALSVAWTLMHEMLFYTVFLAFYFTRFFSAIVAVWAVLIVVGGWIMGAGGIVLAPINLEFIAGMVAAIAARSLPSRGGFALLVVGALGSAASVIWLGSEGYARVWFGLSLALVLPGLVRLEAQGHLTTPGWLMLLGNSSYAIYLVHNPLASLGARLSARIEPLNTWPVSLALCAALGTGIGVLYHLAFEKPALRWFGKRDARPSLRRP
ncbi:acyltransferase [Methylobacterium sp. Leaf456]|uniref:acyltransferase family protein n=1 Tax=Methylobacterium sp. Leaf456 TaxID=1736382 RepID=UPI000A4039C6|nr:acyltransferase [Methylobacterium sp. Leaf456]